MAIPTSLVGAVFERTSENYVKKSQGPKTYVMELEPGSPTQENAKGDLGEVRSSRKEGRAVGVGGGSRGLRSSDAQNGPKNSICKKLG